MKNARKLLQKNGDGTRTILTTKISVIIKKMKFIIWFGSKSCYTIENRFPIL